MGKYIYQKFLLNCDYSDIDLNAFPAYEGPLEQVLPFGESFSIIDYGNPVVRKINLATIDEIVDTEEDWNQFIRSLEDVDQLIITDTKVFYNNLAIEQYRRTTLQAYLYRLGQAGLYLYLNS